MAGEPEKLTLVYLRRLDAGIDLVRDDVREPKVRMTNVEQQLAGVTATIVNIIPRS